MINANTFVGSNIDTINTRKETKGRKEFNVRYKINTPIAIEVFAKDVGTAKNIAVKSINSCSIEQVAYKFTRYIKGYTIVRKEDRLSYEKIVYLSLDATIGWTVKAHSDKEAKDKVKSMFNHMPDSKMVKLLKCIIECQPKLKVTMKPPKKTGLSFVAEDDLSRFFTIE